MDEEDNDIARARRKRQEREKPISLDDALAMLSRADRFVLIHELWKQGHINDAMQAHLMTVHGSTP